MKQPIKNIPDLSILPAQPGVYKFKDNKESIIYIGKAKNLKKRVSSYFSKSHQSGKTQTLVNKIVSVEFTVVNSEWEALLLENSLIKEHQPRYNILLKDDKTYPWLCVSNELLPRIYKTRRRTNDFSHYFGPYSSGYFLKTIQELIRDLFKIRTCNITFNEEGIYKKKYRVCLEYHIGNCLGPCEGFQTIENYTESIDYIIKILKGDYRSLLNILNNKMQIFSESLQFEEAHAIKNKISIINSFQAKSVVVNPELGNVDVFSYLKNNNILYINYLKVIEGNIIQAHNFQLKKILDEKDQDILLSVIHSTRELFSSDAEEIIVPEKIQFDFGGAFFTAPQRGDKKKLLELSLKNAREYKHEQTMHQLKADYGKVNIRLLETVKTALGMNELPVHMECFDNSNIQGESAVAACVVFKNGKPSVKDYRHFNIKTVTGPNDFASMEEIVYRRYKRLLDENQHIPQLVVIDGGKGQLNAAFGAIKLLQLENKIFLISIAKRLEEIFKPGDPLPLYLDKRSEALKVIQRMRDEAHRFGISFHRNKRSAVALQSELLTIPGIGDKTARLLLSEYKSVSNIRQKSAMELEPLIGKVKTKILLDALRG